MANHLEQCIFFELSAEDLLQQYHSTMTLSIELYERIETNLRAAIVHSLRAYSNKDYDWSKVEAEKKL